MSKLLLLILTMALTEAINVNKPSICSFPFQYKGQTYDKCINLDGTAYWCSVEKVYNGTFSYCKVDTSDEIGDEQFLALIHEAEEHTKRLQRLQNSQSHQTDQCTSCISLLKTVSQSTVEQSAIFLDQNKRLQGLKAQHNDLNDVIDQLNKYYQLRRCRQTDIGGEYLGRVSVTRSGFQCQPWASQSPQKHEYTSDDRFPENSIENAQSSCRNPSLDKGPWCLTTNPKQRWEFCHIPKCNVDCKTDYKLNSNLPMCDAYPSTVCKNESLFYNNNCYKAINTPMDYNTAETTCRTYKGHLASVHSAAENIYLAQTIFSGSESFWIGYSDGRKEGSFEWSDGSADDYSRFYSGEPNGNNGENCVEIGRYPAVREAWNDISCGAQRPFVCKMALME